MLATATQAPMLPYLWTSLGGNNVGYGLLMTEFGALTLLGNLLSASHNCLYAMNRRRPVSVPVRAPALVLLRDPYRRRFVAAGAIH